MQESLQKAAHSGHNFAQNSYVQGKNPKNNILNRYKLTQKTIQTLQLPHFLWYNNQV